MRSILFAFAFILIAGVAQAEMKLPGTFVPSLCSREVRPAVATSVLGVRSVCTGNLAQTPQKAIQLTLNDGSTRTYAVEYNGVLGGMGPSRSDFTGKLMSDSLNEDIAGVFSMTSGITATYGISLKTSGNLSFSGPLEPVYTTL